MLSILRLHVSVKICFAGQWDFWIWWSEFFLLSYLEWSIHSICTGYLQTEFLCALFFKSQNAKIRPQKPKQKIKKKLIPVPVRAAEFKSRPALICARDERTENLESKKWNERLGRGRQQKVALFLGRPQTMQTDDRHFRSSFAFLLRTWCSCLFFLLSCLRASRTSPRASFFCRSQFNHLPQKAKSASKQILEEERRNGPKRGKTIVFDLLI